VSAEVLDLCLSGFKHISGNQESSARRKGQAWMGLSQGFPIQYSIDFAESHLKVQKFLQNLTAFNMLNFVSGCHNPFSRVLTVKTGTK
jgi:hypothetical protein